MTDDRSCPCPRRLVGRRPEGDARSCHRRSRHRHRSDNPSDPRGACDWSSQRVDIEPSVRRRRRRYRRGRRRRRLQPRRRHSGATDCCHRRHHDPADIAHRRRPTGRRRAREPQIPLTKRFASAVNRYSISYPDDWTVTPATRAFRYGSSLIVRRPIGRRHRVTGRTDCALHHVHGCPRWSHRELLAHDPGATQARYPDHMPS